MAAGEGTWYLCYFLHRLLEYRLPEVESLAKLFGYSDKLQWKQAPNHHADSPFYYVLLPSTDLASRIVGRSLLLKGIFEIWGEGTTNELLQAAIEAYPDDRKLQYFSPQVTFKIVIDTFGRVISSKEKSDRIESLDYIPFQGHVDLKNPQQTFWLIETDGQVINNGTSPPTTVVKKFFFAREIGTADRSVVSKYALSTRNYLGPTAMDAEIALLMANQALANSGKLIYDPFAGTGSILVAAAHYGALTIGADIDIRVIRDGRGPDCNVWANFKQYGLPAPLGLIRADNNSRPWRSNLREIFDAVVCDPPYGVRAGGRKSGGRKLLKGLVDPYTIPEDKRKEHIPSTGAYTLKECVHDLLDMAAQLLVMGGRLVFFFPQARDGEEYSDSGISIFPHHPCFELVAQSEQILSSRYSRCLLTMEKIRKYSKEIEEEAMAKHIHFRKNNVKLLEESSSNKLHSLVFASAQSYGTCVQQRKEVPKYRSKYV